MPTEEAKAPPETLSLRSHFVAYLDLLGQSQKLYALERLPRTPTEEEHTKAVLADTALLVKEFRETFDRFFSEFEPSQRVLEAYPAGEQRDNIVRVLAAKPRYRGFSDAVVVSVPLVGSSDVEMAAALTAVNRALLAVSSVSLIFFATQGVPVRGGLEVGLGVEMFDREYYGRALVDAYLMESQSAEYPRVLIGQRLFDYLAEVERHEFSDQRLGNFVRQTINGIGSLLVRDPDDGLLSVDPFWHLANESDPHHAHYIALATQMLARTLELSAQYKTQGNRKLAVRYARFSRLLLNSQHARRLA